jgi:hypothetical protein
MFLRYFSRLKSNKSISLCTPRPLNKRQNEQYFGKRLDISLFQDGHNFSFNLVLVLLKPHLILVEEWSWRQRIQKKGYLYIMPFMETEGGDTEILFAEERGAEKSQNQYQNQKVFLQENLTRGARLKHYRTSQKTRKANVNPCLLRNIGLYTDDHDGFLCPPPPSRAHGRREAVHVVLESRGHRGARAGASGQHTLPRGGGGAGRTAIGGVPQWK